jgi:membrane protein implicated in regulation of membrane protease activity
VWPRLIRPIVIAIGIGMHLGIGIFLGMWTFGLSMIIANIAFVSPWVVRRLFDRRSLKENTEQGRGAQSTVSQRAKDSTGSRKAKNQASLASARR